MTKSRLTARIAREQPHLAERDVALAVSMMLEHMTEWLADGGRIEIRNFGSFRPRFRPARLGRNPRTGAPVSIGVRHAPYFKLGMGLRARVDGRRETSEPETFAEDGCRTRRGATRATAYRSRLTETTLRPHQRFLGSSLGREVRESV